MLGGFFRAAGLGLQGYRPVGLEYNAVMAVSAATRKGQAHAFPSAQYAMADPKAIDGNLGTLGELTQWYTRAWRTHSPYPGPILVAAPALEGHPGAKTEKTPAA